MTEPRQLTMKIQKTDWVLPVSWMTTDAISGPTNHPARKTPPSVDSARARYFTGTYDVMNAWRARANTAVASPTTKMPIVSTRGLGATRHTITPAIATRAAQIIEVRSPKRLTTHPLGNVADEFADHDHRGDETGECEARPEVVRSDGDDRNDRAFTDREEQCRQEGGQSDIAETEGALFGSHCLTTLQRSCRIPGAGRRTQNGRLESP